MLDRETCAWLKEVGLPQEINWYNSYYVKSVLTHDWHGPIHGEKTWYGDIRHDELELLKLPTPDDLEAFAIELIQKQNPDNGGWGLVIAWINGDKLWCVGIEGPHGLPFCAINADSDPDKPAALVELIRKLVENE